ncbi:MAG: Peroxisome biosynthesis protein pex1 [Peltula sp. TS41687]|nr:MAG: Peroxisome biosynthesis protein pex1 [Peltula sp. TS41687]
MPFTKRQRHVPAEIALVNLKTCLANLPPSIVSSLLNANAPAQDVIVELSFNQTSSSSSARSNGSSQPKTAYMGWSGMPSTRQKATPFFGRTGLSGTGRVGAGRERNVEVLEIDTKFGHLMGLAEGQIVNVALHLEFPLAHTVSIEPLTPSDWEIIELHAGFLEFNLLAQIRAFPNPSFVPPAGTTKDHTHSLVLHLSPTSTADVIVTSITPTPPSNIPFAKIAPDAEVIVAPKSRARNTQANGESKSSEKSIGNGSAGGKSRTGTVRHGSYEKPRNAPRAFFFRGIDRGLRTDWFEDEEYMNNESLKVWINRESLTSKELKGVQWVYVSILKPSVLLESIEPQHQSPPSKDQLESHPAKPARKVVARLYEWKGAPDSHHAALSTPLLASLGVQESVGSIVRVQAAPPALPGKSIKSFKFYSFSPLTSKPAEGLKVGGDAKAKKEIGDKIALMKGALWSGPLTDGLVLSKSLATDTDIWEGGILRLDLASGGKPDHERLPPSWVLGKDPKHNIEVHHAIPRPSGFFKALGPGESIAPRPPSPVSIDDTISSMLSHLSHYSSLLLTGGLGSGKTSVAQYVAHRLQEESFFHTSYFSCAKLITDETRVSTIKETLDRLFLAASWGSRLGGRAVVILDDLDKLCPVETELQIGNENGRSRQVTELLCSMARQYCGMSKGIVLLATAQGKDSVHNLIVKTHVIKEIIELKAPDKQARKEILETLVKQSTASQQDSDPKDQEPIETHTTGQAGFAIDKNLDFLDVAGQTDGYMPDDLILLISRAKSEALLRNINSLPSTPSTPNVVISLRKEDFSSAIKGFTPASLRNVNLHSATTTFDSIGGLHSVRKTLVETLQYPTKYASIFAKCPLRLRSGLLLYGYPGCGKTLLASAVAGECGLNFISVKGPEILNKYIGASEKSVRDLFERAQAARPSVLFFDEFDSIAPKRGHDSTGVTDRVVNQLLTQMDGAEGLSGVYVLAATSRPDLIDPALLRPGRLDKSLMCDLPTHDERIDILDALSRKLKLGADVKARGFEWVADHTEYYSGADLQALIYNAQLEAIHDVLGDRTHSVDPNARPIPPPDDNDHRSPTSTSITTTTDPPAFITFRLGGPSEQDQTPTSPTSSSSSSARDRASILKKLQAIRDDNPTSNQHLPQIDDDDDDDRPQARHRRQRREKQENTEVTIQHSHLVHALQSSKPSVSARERNRLQAIYDEFVSGRRSTDLGLLTGEASGEVGGRVSLM